eukprot:6478145-Amphidinium_carterae.1
MLLYSDSWPQALAPLGQDDRTQAEATVRKLRTHAGAVAAALSSGRPDLEQAASRSGLNSTYMRHVLARMSASYWSPVPTCVQRS